MFCDTVNGIISSRPLPTVWSNNFSRSSKTQIIAHLCQQPLSNKVLSSGIGNKECAVSQCCFDFSKGKIDYYK